jgi:membrane protein YdbS with pleckstrin-like domain
MLSNEPMTETTPQARVEPLADDPVIVTPGAPDAIVQPVRPETNQTQAAETTAPGIEGEETVWEGHYSGRNFIGRMAFGGLLVAVWIFLALYNWGTAPANASSGRSFWTLLAGLITIGYWANLGYRYLRAYRGHHYRLTNRRLFVTTGFFNRRVDQLELIRIKDVYIQQSMIGDWLGIGNVVVISSEPTLPKVYLLGINEPRRIMDLIWHHMRLEQSAKTDRINPV